MFSLRSMLCVAAVAALGARAVPAHAQQKGEVLIGYVHLQRAILEVEEGKRAKKQLKATFDDKQKRLSEKEAELVKLKDALEKEAAAKPDDPDLRKKALDFQNRLLELKQTFMKEQQELQESEQKQLSGITGKMRKIIDEIGQTGNYTIILEVQDSRLLFAKPHLDLTNEVIRKYNNKHK